MTPLLLTHPRNRREARSGHRPYQMKPLGGNHIACMSSLRDSDGVLEQDHKVLEYCWNASTSKDICEASTRVLPGTFSMDLFSDTEFLVYKLPKMGRGMPNDSLQTSLEVVTCGVVFWLMCLSHSRLHNKQEGIKQRPGSIKVGLQWID